jgi:rsbT antagonist protein RsbS
VFVSILRQGDFLIASIHAALNDAELMEFQADLIAQIGSCRAYGVIIDVAALDVLDSFASKSLRDLATMARLRGAETVIVGIQPDVALAIVRLGMELDVRTALDLEEGLICLEAATSGHRVGHSTLGALDHGQRGSADTKPLAPA